MKNTKKRFQKYLILSTFLFTFQGLFSQSQGSWYRIAQIEADTYIADGHFLLEEDNQVLSLYIKTEYLPGEKDQRKFYLKGISGFSQTSCSQIRILQKGIGHPAFIEINFKEDFSPKNLEINIQPAIQKKTFKKIQFEKGDLPMGYKPIHIDLEVLELIDLSIENSSENNRNYSPELQTLSISGQELSISGGNTVIIPCCEDESILNLQGNTLSINEKSGIELSSSFPFIASETECYQDSIHYYDPFTLSGIDLRESSSWSPNNPDLSQLNSTANNTLTFENFGGVPGLYCQLQLRVVQDFQATENTIITFTEYTESVEHFFFTAFFYHSNNIQNRIPFSIPQGSLSISGGEPYPDGGFSVLFRNCLDMGTDRDSITISGGLGQLHQVASASPEINGFGGEGYWTNSGSTDFIRIRYLYNEGGNSVQLKVFDGWSFPLGLNYTTIKEYQVTKVSDGMDFNYYTTAKEDPQDTIRLDSIPTDWKICPGQGAVWFVSPDGNNMDAVKGKRDKPFSDPWTARNDARVAENDLIHVLPGEYSFSGIANKETINLWRNGDWYFESGAKIKIEQNYSSIDYPALFNDAGHAGTCHVSGSADFEITSGQSNNLAIATLENDSSFLHFECNEIIHATMPFNWLKGDGNIDVQSYRIPENASNYGFFHFVRPWNTIQTSQSCDININLDYVIDKNSPNNAPRGVLFGAQCCAGHHYINDLNLNYNIGHVQMGEHNGFSDYGGLISFTHDVTFDSCQIAFQLGTISQKNHTFFPPDEGKYLTHRNEDGFPTMIEFGANLKNSQITIDCENCKADVQWIRPKSGLQESYHSDVYINGNYQSNWSHTIVLDLFGTQSTDVNYHFDGVFINTHKNVLADIRSSENINILLSGKYITQSDSVVFALTYPIHLINAYLETEGTEKDIYANQPVNVLAMGSEVTNGVYSNITIQQIRKNIPDIPGTDDQSLSSSRIENEVTVNITDGNATTFSVEDADSHIERETVVFLDASTTIPASGILKKGFWTVPAYLNGYFLKQVQYTTANKSTNGMTTFNLTKNFSGFLASIPSGKNTVTKTGNIQVSEGDVLQVNISNNLSKPSPKGLILHLTFEKE